MLGSAATELGISGCLPEEEEADLLRALGGHTRIVYVYACFQHIWKVRTNEHVVVFGKAWQRYLRATIYIRLGQSLRFSEFGERWRNIPCSVSIK